MCVLDRNAEDWTLTVPGNSKIEGDGWGNTVDDACVLGPHLFILQIVICAKLCRQSFSGILERISHCHFLFDLLGFECHQSPKRQWRILMYIQVCDSSIIILIIIIIIHILLVFHLELMWHFSAMEINEAKISHATTNNYCWFKYKA